MTHAFHRRSTAGNDTSVPACDIEDEYRNRLEDLEFQGKLLQYIFEKTLLEKKRELERMLAEEDEWSTDSDEDSSYVSSEYDTEDDEEGGEDRTPPVYTWASDIPSLADRAEDEEREEGNEGAPTTLPDHETMDDSLDAPLPSADGNEVGAVEEAKLGVPPAPGDGKDEASHSHGAPVVDASAENEEGAELSPTKLEYSVTSSRRTARASSAEDLEKLLTDKDVSERSRRRKELKKRRIAMAKQIEQLENQQRHHEEYMRQVKEEDSLLEDAPAWRKAELAARRKFEAQQLIEQQQQIALEERIRLEAQEAIEKIMESNRHARELERRRRLQAETLFAEEDRASLERRIKEEAKRAMEAELSSEKRRAELERVRKYEQQTLLDEEEERCALEERMRQQLLATEEAKKTPAPEKDNDVGEFNWFGNAALDYGALRARDIPAEVDAKALERYLSDAKFEELLGVHPSKFDSQPAWRRTQQKTKAGLF